MKYTIPIITAKPFTSLPKKYYHQGEPSPWAKMTRPGQAMHSFLEGMFFDEHNNIWLSDVPYGRAFRVKPDRSWEMMHQIEGELHAMRFSPEGNTIGVDYKHGLIKLNSKGTFEILCTGLKGQKFKGLSDLAYGPDGTLWFTDSGRTSLNDPTGCVYCLSPDKTLHLVTDCVPYANGICVSPDGKWVYVAATRANQIWKFAAFSPPDTRPMIGMFLQLSGGLGPDGLATNKLGWLAIAQAQAGRAYIYDEIGDPIAEIRLPEGMWATSVIFDPHHHRRLFISEAEFATIFVAEIPN